MSWKSDLRELFDALLRSRDRLIELSKSQGDGWQTDYGRARQDLRRDLEALELTCTRFLGTASNPALEDYTKAVVEFREGLDRHHARWPVLIIKDRGPEYAESMKDVDAGFRNLQRMTDAL